MRAWAAKGTLVVAATAAALVLAEIALRLLDVRSSPIAFLEPENADDWRAYHMRGRDSRLRTRGEPFTVFDERLLWRMSDTANPEIDAQGFRRAGGRPPLGKDTALVLAVGDSNTTGALDVAEHWPGLLEALAARDRPSRPVQVWNAGAYGYTSFQGLRRFESLAAPRPAIAYFSFGANDAQPVRTTDEAYAARLDRLSAWRGSRLAPLLAQAFWALRDRRAGEATTWRVPPEDFRRNLTAFVALARSRRVTPVLLTRPYVEAARAEQHWMERAAEYRAITKEVAAATGAECVDAFAAFADMPEAFADPSHFNRLGLRRMAELLVRHLKKTGLVATDDGFPLAADVAPGRAEDRAPELGPGWWWAETAPTWGPGRWTHEEALLFLRRARQERALVLDLVHSHPRAPEDAFVEVNGQRLLDLGARRGRLQVALDLSGVEGRDIVVRLVMRPPFVPRETDERSDDARKLGLFVREARLADAAPADVEAVRAPTPPRAASIDLGVAADDAAELGAGWWTSEAWTDGARGRWTKGEADVHLVRAGAETTLVVEAVGQAPKGLTRGEIRVGGRPGRVFAIRNGAWTWRLDVRGVPGRRVDVRVAASSPFVPARTDRTTGDTRLLGLFVRRVALSNDPADAAAVN